MNTKVTPVPNPEFRLQSWRWLAGWPFGLLHGWPTSQDEMLTVVAEMGLNCTVPSKPYCAWGATPLLWVEKDGVSQTCRWCDQDFGLSSISASHKIMDPCSKVTLENLDPTPET